MLRKKLESESGTEIADSGFLIIYEKLADSGSQIIYEKLADTGSQILIRIVIPGSNIYLYLVLPVLKSV